MGVTTNIHRTVKCPKCETVNHWANLFCKADDCETLILGSKVFIHA
jgi:hypothetical protein